MTPLLKQGTLAFSVGFKQQTTWGFMEALIFSLEGLGATVFAYFVLEGNGWGMLSGVVLVAGAVSLLLAHLGHPFRAWMAFLNLRHSWISRGTILLSGFVALALLYLLLRAAGGLSPGWAATLRWVLLAACLCILAYPGFVLSSSPSIPFWNSGLLPLFSLFNGLSSGLAVALVYAAFRPGNGAGFGLEGLAVLQLSALGLFGITVFSYVSIMRRATAAAAESARMLFSAERVLFGVLGCGLGLLLPLLLTLGVALGVGAEEALAGVSALAKVAGDVALRHAFLKVGLFDPVV